MKVDTNGTKATIASNQYKNRIEKKLDIPRDLFIAFEADDGADLFNSLLVLYISGALWPVRFSNYTKLV